MVAPDQNQVRIVCPACHLLLAELRLPANDAHFFSEPMRAGYQLQVTCPNCGTALRAKNSAQPGVKDEE